MQKPLFDQTYDTISTATGQDQLVALANAHIDRMYTQGGKVGESFFHAMGTYLSSRNIAQGNGGPFGAVLVRFEGGLDAEGRGIGKPSVIGVGTNHVVPKSDPSAHAEMEAYRDAAQRQGYSDLKGAVLFTSCECCPMCLSVANGAGISRISYINTRAQADAIDFSDKLQYELFSRPLSEMMTPSSKVGDNRRADLLHQLGSHAVAILDAKGEVYASGDADLAADPTGLASIRAVQAAIRRHADEQAAQGSTAPVFCLPEGCTMVTREIPHPAGLITFDWARGLRERDPQAPDNPHHDKVTPRSDRIICLSDDYERLVVMDAKGQRHERQPTEVTYRQPTLSDKARAVPTDHHKGPVVSHAGRAVFSQWGRQIGLGEQVRY